jgi:hypothetical protein
MKYAAILLGTILSSLGQAQAQTPQIGFFFRTATSQTAPEVFPNGTLAFENTLINGRSTATVIIRNRGTATINLRSATATGPFGANLTSTTIDPGEQVNVNLEFTPRQVDVLTGQLTLAIAVDPSRTISYVFFLSGRGIAPDFVVSYILNPGGNQVAVADGGIIQFNRTALGDDRGATATIAILNRGNGPGTLNSVSISGEPFSLSGVPLLPLQIAADRGEVRFTLTFKPVNIDVSNGSLLLTFADRTVRVQISGQGVGPLLNYSLASGGTTSRVTPGATVNLPDTQVNETRTAVFTIDNTGNGEARLGSIVLAGAGYAAVDIPGLPFTLPVGASLSITIRFTPAQVGPQTATLRVDNAAFTLRGVGVGRSLRLTGIVGSNSVPVPSGGTLSFQNADIGVATRATIEVTNSGNADAILNVVTVSGTGFAIPDPLPLPLTIPPNQRASFVVTFTPDNTGASTGTLVVEDVTVTLRGTGNTPPPVPPVQFIGLTPQVAAREQPAVSLRLERPYPLDLTGTMTVAFSSDSFADDPAIQFSTGGRTVAFRIPANTLEAEFRPPTNPNAPALDKVGFQTGTVAGTISLAVALATGRVNLTPNPAPATSTVVPPAAPALASLQLSARTATSVTLLLSGTSTARSVTQLNFAFAAATGGTLQTTSLNFNAEEAFRAWYQSEASRPFGSQFTATINLQVNGDVNALQSITVTAVNARGTSSPVSVNLR